MKKALMFLFLGMMGGTLALGSIVEAPPQAAQTVETAVGQNKVQDYKLAQQIYQGILRSYNFVWHNAKYTPGEILTQYGMDAEALFTVSTTLQTVLCGGGTPTEDNPCPNSLIPNFKPLTVPPAYTVTFNADHSVSVVEAIPQDIKG